MGFASATDMNVGMTAGMAEIAAFEAAKSAGRLPLRMWQVLAGNPEGIAAEAWAAGLRPMDGDDSLRWGAVKVFADGSAGGLTAAFFDRYLPADTRGVFTFPDETIHNLLRQYHEQGWQLDIHAIGDAAIEQVLAGMEYADTPDHPFTGRRHRIEHCGFVTRHQRRRMLARGILPVPQPVFLYEFGDTYVANLGLRAVAVRLSHADLAGGGPPPRRLLRQPGLDRRSLHQPAHHADAPHQPRHRARPRGGADAGAGHPLPDLVRRLHPIRRGPPRHARARACRPISPCSPRTSSPSTPMPC